LLGVWFNRDKIGAENLKIIQEEATHLEKQYPGWRAGSGGWWFALYKQKGNVNEKSNLLEWIPESREPLAQSYAEEIVETVNLFGSFCLKHI
jgi:hypothetical protein